jgi:hypothetical protein
MRNLAIGTIFAISISTAHGAWWDVKPADTTAPAPAAPDAQPATPPAVTAGQKPTLDDLKQLVQDQKYQPALQAAAWLLGAQQSPDRYDVLLLKAQALLGLKSASAAISAYQAAATATKEADQTALASASAELVAHSPAFVYQPRFSIAGGQDEADPTDPPDDDNTDATKTNVDQKNGSRYFKISATPMPRGTPPIGVVDADSRDKALAAYYVDQLAVALPALKEADKSQLIPPLLSAMKMLAHLRTLDLAANKNANQVDSMSHALAIHADKLMTNAINKLAKDAQGIIRKAEEGGVYGVRRGLEGNDPATLRTIAATADDITAACKEFSRLSARDSKMFDFTGTSAQRIASRIKAALGTPGAN